MTFDFTSSSTVISGRWEAVCNGTPFVVEKNLPQAGLELGTARSANQRLTHWVTGAPSNNELCVLQLLISAPTVNTDKECWYLINECREPLLWVDTNISRDKMAANAKNRKKNFKSHLNLNQYLFSPISK